MSDIERAGHWDPSDLIGRPVEVEIDGYAGPQVLVGVLMTITHDIRDGFTSAEVVIGPGFTLRVDSSSRAIIRPYEQPLPAIREGQQP